MKWIPKQEEKLIHAKKRVEEKFEATKWNQIAATLEVMGGGKYPISMLRKKYRELSSKATEDGNANVEDSDSEDIEEGIIYR